MEDINASYLLRQPTLEWGGTGHFLCCCFSAATAFSNLERKENEQVTESSIDPTSTKEKLSSLWAKCPDDPDHGEGVRSAQASD